MDERNCCAISESRRYSNPIAPLFRVRRSIAAVSLTPSVANNLLLLTFLIQSVIDLTAVVRYNCQVIRCLIEFLQHQMYRSDRCRTVNGCCCPDSSLVLQYSLLHVAVTHVRAGVTPMASLRLAEVII